MAQPRGGGRRGSGSAPTTAATRRKRRPQAQTHTMLLLLLVVLVTPPACHAFLVGRLHHLQPHKSAGRLGQQPAAAPPPPRLQPLIEAVAAAAIPGGLGGVIDADDGGLAGKTGEDGDDDDGDSSSDVGDGPPVGGFGLTWYGAERYSQQPDFPVLFVATRNESYARETERHFSEQGYFVRSTRTVTRLAKMVRSTRPEAVLLADHLSAPHVLSFLESLRDLPDLWLVPVLLVHDPLTPTTGSTTTTLTDTSTTPSSPDANATVTSAFAAYPLAQLHKESLRLGARCVVDPGVSGEMLQATVEGARRTRGDVEGLVHNLQGAVLHWTQHRRRLLPSTVAWEGPPPELTSTEQEVLNLLCRGMTDGQIAHSLGLTRAAVGHAARGLMEKLGCDLRGEVIRVALDNDLLTE